MTFYLRKIDYKIHWVEKPEWLKDDCIPANAITCTGRDIRTTDNTLSLWDIGNDKAKLRLALLASIAGKKEPHTADISYVILRDRELESDGLQIEISEPTSSKCKGVDNIHYDIIEMDHNCIISIAKIIRGKFLTADENFVNIYTLTDIALLYDEGVKKGWITDEDIPIKVRTWYKQEIERQELLQQSN